MAIRTNDAYEEHAKTMPCAGFEPAALTRNQLTAVSQNNTSLKFRCESCSDGPVEKAASRQHLWRTNTYRFTSSTDAATEGSPVAGATLLKQQ